MATTIGSLAVRVGADTTGLMTGLDNSSKKLDQFGTKVRSSANDLGKYAAAATAAGLAIGAALVAKQLKVIDTLAKTSDKLGITTEALSGLRHAAELTGVSSTTLDMALQRMTRRVAEAANGSGEAKDAIKELGLNAQALARMTPDQQMKTFADAMQGVAGQGDKVRLAMKLFDSEGVALVNTLALGSKGLAEMQAEADRLGISLTRVQAAQVEAANDALTRSGAVMQGVVRRATIDLAPVIEAVANEFTNAAMATDNFGTAAIDTVKMIMTPIGVLLDGLRGIQVAVKGVEFVFTGLGFGAVSSFNMIVKGYTELANLIPGIDVDFQDTFLGKLEQSAADATDKAAAELQELAMTTIPSEQIDNWLERVRNASEVAAKAVAENRALISGGGDLGSGGMSDDEKKKLAEKLEAIRESYLSEQALLDEKLALELETIAAGRQAKLDLGVSYDELEQQAKAAHESALTKLQQEEIDKRAKSEKQYNDFVKQQKVAVYGELANLLSQFGGKHKAAALASLAIQKALAISSVATSTAAGAALAMASQLVPGDPSSLARGAAAAAKVKTLGAVQMGLIAATGLAQGASIGSGGGGGIGAGVGGGGDTVQSQNNGGGSSGRTLAISGINPNDLFTGRQLVELINQAQEDGARIITV